MGLIAMRLKSVTNIQKITMSMKMVSAAKYARAERDLKAARPLGEAASVFYDQAEVSCEKEQPKNLYVAITSDRGLAGGVHSSICKAIRNELQEMTPEAAANTKVICVGDKSRAFMARFPQEPHHGGLRDRTSATPVWRRRRCGERNLEQRRGVRPGQDDVQQVQVRRVLRHYCHPPLLPRDCDGS